MSARMSMLVLIGALALGACGHNAHPGDAEERDLLRARVNASLADFKAADPSLGALMNSAQAYVIFPRIISAAVGIGGAHGNGEVYQKGKFLGYADVSQGSIGAQLGGQRYGELLVFQNEGAFIDFTHGTLEFDARATAIAASKGGAAAADPRRGVLVFTLPESGLMAQAAIGGQKFRYTEADQR